MKALYKLTFLFTGLFFLSMYSVCAQQNLVYSHYFMNPFLYNPSYVAPDGYAELYLNYRNQWAGIEGAPTTGTVSIHLPINYKAGIAFTGYQDKAGVLKTSTGLVTFAYQVYLGNRISDNHKIAFGLSAGMTSTSITPDDSYASDPVVGSTSSFEGQFGIHYQLKNFKIGFAIPRLFRTYVASEQDFNKVGIEQIRTTITSVSYTIPLSSKLLFEPTATYRTYQNTKGQMEALGVLRVNNLVWLGGSYRQDYGATAFVGFNAKDKFKLGYAYEFATSQVNSLGDGTHELQLTVRLGKKKSASPKIKTKLKDVRGSAYVEEQPLQQSRTIEIAPDEPSDPSINRPTSTGTTSQQQTVRPSESSPIASADTENQKKEPVKSLSGNGLPAGHYVVVGAFRSVENAKSYARSLKRAGYPADIAYHPEKKYYIVHMTNAPTLEEAKQLRDKYRQMSRYSFRDTWILSIE